MKKALRFTSAFLAIIMLVAVLPLSAFASEDDCPIIFIPGIMGSRLFTSDKIFNDFTCVWDPSVFFLSSFASIIKNCELHVIPPVNMNAKGAKREYGTFDTSKTMVDALCDQFPDREVYFFSYDFRKSTVDAAEKLNAFIEESNFDKVDFVAHSMGGLVVSNYVGKYGFDKVNKMISCGTPYMGSATMLNVSFGKDLLTSDAVADGIEDMLLKVADYFVSGPLGLDRELRTSLVSCAELLPFVQSAEKTPMMKYKGLSMFIKPSFMYKPASLAEYKTLCKDLYGAKYDTAAAVQSNLYNNVYPQILDYENAYFVLGTAQKTISSIYYSGKGARLGADKFKTTIGDGTVTLDSESILGAVFELDSSRYCIQKTTHGGTAGQDDSEASRNCLEYVIDILKDGVSDVRSAA